MNRTRWRIGVKGRVFLLLVVLLTGLVVLLNVTLPLPGEVGKGDLRFNWIAGYLLAHGENMYANDLIWEAQRNLTGAKINFVSLTLSPPWAVLILIPYTWLPFDRAAGLWLLTNILITAVGALVLWRNATRSETARRKLWIPLLVVFSFSITLTAISIGQMTLFVLGMIVAFIALEEKGYDVAAGFALAGMLVKPQMVLFTLLVVSLQVFYKRRWRIALGGLVCAAAAGIVLFILRPAWPSEYFEVMANNNAIAWQSSNLAGLALVLTGDLRYKLWGVILAPFVLLAWWRFGRQVSMRVLVDISLLLSLIASPYGFSYDQVALISPVIAMLALVIEMEFPRILTGIIIGSLIAVDLASYYVRFHATNEVQFFWIPLCIAFLYAFTLWQASRLRYAAGTRVVKLPLGSDLA
ncbi:MAG: glycosyltransferase family 87 protein [Anaerolineae bacterium]